MNRVPNSTSSMTSDADLSDGRGTPQPARDGVPRRSPASRRTAVSVVVPAYNEAAGIASSLERLCTYLRSLESRYDWEVVVVDDGSDDDTALLAEMVAATWPEVRVLRHRTNFNLGQALRYAFSRCEGDYVVTLDSDLSYAPEHVGLLLEAIEASGAKIVIASPYAAGGRTTGVPLVRRLLSRGANRFLSHMTRRELATLTGMVRIYDRPFLQSLDLRSTDVGINTEIIYKAQLLKARICEIPAHLDWSGQRELPERRSSLRVTQSVLTYLASGFLFRPLAFFALPGMVLLLLSLYTMGWVGIHVGSELLAGPGIAFSEAVSRAFAGAPHTFIVGGISLVLAIQLLSLGILAAQSKAYFEETFHLGTGLRRHALGLPPRTTSAAPRRR
jgi:glycosyltransferase involved in cell wall biosynthesis